MKKVCIVSVVLLFVSMVAYGTEWKSGTNKLYSYPYSTTKVGIGVTSPQSKLHVQCSAYGPIPDEQQSAIYGYNTGSSYNPIGVYGRVNSSGGRAICGYAGSGGYGGYFRGRGYFSENVGIGTTSPQEKLHVNGSIRGNQNGALRINTGYGYVDIGPRTSSWAHFRTDRARYHFDKEIRVDGGYIGSYNENLSLRTSGTTRMTISNSNGNVGIGTLSPDYKLDVSGTARFEDVNPYVKFYDTDTESPYHTQCLIGRDGYFLVQAYNGSTWTSTMKLQPTIQYFPGNVGIGTTDPGSYKLAVNGHIKTKAITVESDWSDFVFEDDYKLMPLEKLEKHIKNNKSLPGIPTEKEVKENGVEVGEMQSKLLEKVEELTLYVIELKKENDELKNRIKALEN